MSRKKIVLEGLVFFKYGRVWRTPTAQWKGMEDSHSSTLFVYLGNLLFNGRYDRLSISSQYR